jgi:pimeloyl-ACP methyl ester carboxylesterase
MSGTTPRVAAPIPFTPEQLQSISIPVLLILGKKDNLVGDPAKVKELAKNVPDIQIEILNTGHLISADQPDTVNNLIYEFFEQH